MAHTSLFPLAEIAETKTFPHARTLRTSFFQKLKDTYNALAGKLPLPLVNQQPHVGIFDYLTLFIPAGLFFLLIWCLEDEKSNFFAKVLLIPAILINIPFLVARVALSAVATIIFSPIIAIVHGISQLVAGQSHTKALGLIGQLKNGDKQSLGNYLVQNNMDIEELFITIKKSPKETKSAGIGEEACLSSYQLRFWKKNTDPSDVLLEHDCEESYGEERPPFAIKISQEKTSNNNQAQATNIHALFKLNVGGVVANIENTAKANILAI